MKVSSINYTNSILKRNTEQKNSNQKNPAFGSFLVNAASFIENNGFMGEFLTIDTLGMGAPRAAQGYTRNWKELGHLNYKAGHEEVTRELLSGPAFFFVPLIVTTAFALVKGKSALVQKNKMLQIHKLLKKTDVNLNNAAETKRNFVKTVIKEAFGENPNQKEMVNEFSNLMEKNFTEKFSMADYVLNIFRKDKVATRKSFKQEAENLLTKINKANEEFLDNAGSLKIGEERKGGRKIVESANIKEFLDDTRDYLNDFTNKAVNTKKDKNTFIDDFQKQAAVVRTVAELASLGALSAFITYIPKLYQTGNNFPGKDGLVNNRTEQNAQDTKPSEQKTKEVA